MVARGDTRTEKDTIPSDYQSQRIFVAASVTQAMQAVRKEMGEQAVIIQVRKHPGDNDLVEVIASENASDNNVASVITTQKVLPANFKQVGLWIDALFDEIHQQRLLDTAEQIATQQPDLSAEQQLQRMLSQEITFFDIVEEHIPDAPVLLFGPSGMGKTSFGMKLALAHRLHNLTLRLINIDSKRIGSRHLISHFAKLIDMKAHHLQFEGARKKLAETTEELTIIDTPPFNPFESKHAEQILKPFAQDRLCRLLVISMWSNRAILQDTIDALSQHTAIDGIVATGLDCVPAYHTLFNLLLDTGLPLAAVSASDAVIDGVMPLDMAEYTRRMLHYCDKSQTARRH